MSLGVAGVIANPEESNIFQILSVLKQSLYWNNNLQNIPRVICCIPQSRKSEYKWKDEYLFELLKISSMMSNESCITILSI